MPYASEVGIIFGDPMIRLEVEDDLISDGTGYSKDIGKPIYTGNQEIIEMVDFDYNGDDYDDLLLVYESGQIRLLENEITNSRFRDRGVILNIPDGITSMTKIDFNNDAFDDLVVGTKLSCRVDDECITLFENVDGHFERKPLNLALNGKKAYEMASDDMNADGCADIVIADSSGSISVFYNEIVNSACNGLDLDVGYTNNFGYVLDSDANLAEQIFIHYDGMETPVQDDASDGEVDENHSNLHKFIQFILPSSDPPPIVEEPDAEGLNAGQYAADAAAFADALNSNPNLASSSVPPMQYPTEYDFIHLPEDARVLTSTKTATDLNGEAVGEGDEISYLITLKNTSGSSISDLMLSDATPASMTFLEDSLECLDVNCPDDLELVETGTSLRSHVFKGISVPAHGQRVIQYKMKVLVMPKVKFDIGNNFTNYPSGNNDAYLDILVKPAVNPDGILTYIHSSGKYANGHVNYKVFKKPSVNTDTSGPLKDAFEDLGLPDPMALLGFDPAAGEVPEDLQGQVMDIVAKQAWDADYDGCNDDWFGKSNADMGVDADGDGEIDGAGGGAGGGGSAGKGSAAGSIADSVEGALGALRCSGGGCLPIPYNFAFFAPDDATPGIAAMAFGTPNIPFFMPFYPSTSPSSFRIYVNPTLTMGLGGGLCGGTGPAAVCFPYAVPGGLPGASGLCDALTTGIDEAVSSAKDSVVNADQATVISDGEPAGQSGASGGSFGSADDPMSAAVSTNIKIPGFPSVLTNWMDKQMDEIYNKLLDFPDLYIVYPDLTSLFKIKDPPADGNQEVDFLGLHDFLTKVSSVPIISIEGKEVLIRVPAISPKEIQQFNQEAAKWVEFHQKEWERFKDFNCSVEDELNPERRNFCDKITADVGNLVQSVQELMDLMDKIANLPRDILTYRHAEAKYATQIICYMDAIINFTGGWFKRQEGRIKAWRKSIQDAIRTFSDWQLILDVVAEYQASCDQCKSDRFGKLALLMQLFAAIPEPPIIPLPKWPDIIVDLSQIRTGVKILWPDVVFKPQLISLPALPYFTLPDILPDIDLDLDIPEISVPDFPDFVLPNLPDLPPLPLPTLPDLPRPPRIPALPDVVADLAVGLKTIFKILCLLKNGFILIPETKLATEIETLTQPSVQAVLPFTKHLGTQIPPIQYDAWKEVHITGKLNFKIDSSIIHIAAEKAAQVWNKNIKLFINGLNRYLELPYGQMISSAVQKAIDAAEKAALEATLEAIEDAIEDDEDSVDEAVDDTEEDKKDEGAESSLPFAFTEFNDAVKEMELVLNEYIAATDLDTPDSYTLTATETLLDINHPLLNRTIDEIEADILKRDNPDTPSASHLADVRNEMIAYVKGLNNSIDLLEQIDDYEEFTRVLVDTDESSSKIAALTTDYGEISGRSTTEKMSLLGSAAEELILDSAFKDHRELIAGLADYDPADVASGDASTGVPPIGIYIVTKDGVNENILSYTPELKKNTSFIYSDVDDDLDDDIILSMGTNVYLKENHEKDNPLPKGKFISSLSKDDVSDYVTDGGVAVQGVSSPYESHDKADISWLPIHGTVAYEVIIRNSIDSSLINPIAKYIALPNSIEDSSSVDILNYLNIPIPGPDEDDGSVLELTNADLPAISVELKNGNYYASVFALNSNGNRSLRSDYSFVAPQSCADKEPPFPVIGSADLNVSIYKDLEIDASGSFDADGEVVEYYIEMLPYETDKTDPNTGEKLRTTPMPKYFWSDLNVTVDSDGDGLTMNDRNNPEFRIGPFVHEGDIGKHPAILHVVDQSGNSSAMDLDINVFAPDISLDPTFARTSVATGETDPKVPILPFSLMRNRYIYRLVGEEIKLVPRTDKIKDGLTFEDGSYEIDDFNLENMILVENSDKEIIAEIHPDTGDIGALQPGYSTVTVPASLPNTPTQVDIVDSNGIVLGSVIAVADANTDVQIHEELGIDSTNFKEMTGVNIDDLDIADKFEFVSLPANDPNHPGGAVLVNVTEEKLLTLIDAAGNIMILDDRITIVQKQNQHTADPLIIQILFNGNAVGDVFVSTSQGDSSLQTSSGSTIIGPNDVPFATPRPPSTKTLYGNDVFGGPFNDMPSDLKALALDLFNKGIIDADKDALGGLQLDTEALVKRKEFVKTLLKLLCIIPRPEAHEPDTIYTDLPFEDDFFPYVKEGTLLDLVEGYKGEIDPVSGKLPFKPDNTITRAEAVKIILEALEMQGIITLETLVEGEPWYETFMEAAQDLNPYVVSGAILENNFIITPEEAVAPNKEMTFGELMLMADRVLDFYNCFEIDDDNDGMSDFCELKYDIDDPEADIDQDGLKNADECFYGLDPRDKDTDKGGVFDGEEVALGTNGLDDSDDSADDDNDGLTNRAEILIHGTDPNNPDTDGGGVIDGDEVKNLTDPNVKNDDDGGGAGDAGDGDGGPREGEEGIYIIPASCDTCPCISTFLNKAEIIPGDVFFPVISKYYEEYYDSKPHEKLYIFSKGNEVTVQSVTK